MVLHPPLESSKPRFGMGARTLVDEGVALCDFLAQARKLVVAAMTLTGTHRFITPDDEALALALDLGNIGIEQLGR